MKFHKSHEHRLHQPSTVTAGPDWLHR
jgi:hypothetical protein